ICATIWHSYRPDDRPAPVTAQRQMIPAGKTAKQTSGAQAIRRAVDLLRAVAMTQRRGANLATLSRATGLSRSTAFRMLHSLTEEGMLDYDPATHCYVLGRLAYELGLAAKGDAQLAAQWSDTLDRVRDRTGMTAYLVARSDLEV